MSRNRSRSSGGFPCGVHVLWQLRQRDFEVGQELPSERVGVQAIDVCLLQVLGLEDWGRLGACSHHATPLLYFDCSDDKPHAPHTCCTSNEAGHADLASPPDEREQFNSTTSSQPEA